MTTGDRIKDLETQLRIVCLTRLPKLNQAEPEFFKFQVPTELYMDDIEITVHKRNLNVKSIFNEVVKASYVAGCNNGIVQGNKQIVNKFKELFKI